MQGSPERQPDTGPVIVGVMPNQPAQVIVQASRFARALHSAMICIWVDASAYPRPAGPEDTPDLVPLDPDIDESASTEAAEKLRQTLAERLDTQDMAWTFVHRAGEPAREIAQLARQKNASLIVVGTREPGLGAHLEEMFTGSVAVHLAHRQACPVLVVPLYPKAYGAIS